MNEILYTYKSDNLYIHHTVTSNPDCNAFSFKSHSHNMYEIYYFLSGDAEYAVEGKIHSLTRGSLIVTEKGQTHNIIIKSSDIPYERIAILFTKPHLSKISSYLSKLTRHGNNLFSLTDKEQVWVEECVQIIKDYNADKEDFEKTAEAVIETILAKIEILSQNRPQVTFEKDDLVREIIKFINENIENDWSLDTLEKTLFRDKAYLNRRFKSVMGCGIWEYNLRKRIFSSQQQLYITRNISSAFANSGFNDYSSFYRKYKKYIGKSPLEDLTKFKNSN